MDAASLMFTAVDELARLVHDGELRASELVGASLERIEALDLDVNAFVDVLAEDALAEAATIGPGDPRPFAGVPIAIKNNRGVAGRRLTSAAALMGDFLAPSDHNVVARLKAAGFVIVGTTTLPEYGIMPVTETARFGPTRNPWDLDRTPGGSSGGSAAAVAAGMVPIAHANDGGGSTRIPAACCGLVGLKPQRGRISVAPELGDSLLVQDGVLTRTVRETALVLDLLEGYVEGDATWAPPPVAPFATALSAAARPQGLRVAVATSSPLPEATVDPVVAEAVRTTGRALAGLGHHVEEVDPPWAAPGLEGLFTALFAPLVCTQAAFAGLLAGRHPTAADMEPLSWHVWELAAGLTSTQAALAEARVQGIARGFLRWMASYDVLVCPTLSEAPVPIGTIDPLGPDPAATFARAGAFVPHTPLANMTGQPAISLPLATRPEGDPAAGLPVGVQLLGRPAREDVLLAVAAQLEVAMPWAHRRARAV